MYVSYILFTQMFVNIEFYFVSAYYIKHWCLEISNYFYSYDQKKKKKGHKIMCASEATNRTYPGLKICKYAIGSICTYMYGYNNNIFMRRITIKRNDER